MSAFSNWPLSSGSARIDLHDLCIRDACNHPLVNNFMVTAAGYYHRAAGHFMRRTEHDEHLIAYVTSGHGYLQIGGSVSQIYEVGPGSLWWIPPNVPHYYYASPNEPWSVYWAHAQKSEALDIYNFIGLARNPVVTIGVASGLALGFEKIINRLGGNEINVLALASASASLKAWLFDAAIMLNEEKCYHKFFHEKVEKYFLERVGDPMNLDEIASEFNISKYHFARKFKKITGKTPARAFMEQKINHACDLLSNDGVSIGQISYRLGFSDESYFTKVFTRYIGLTPSKYRSSLIKAKGVI
ncbi:helix-turn-helix domain-containing protein [Halomonas alkalicola]|uniref:AraC family transcriptional regulator n=1 Tax=Halomonas alkalicola TaxID=1930622 RepID=UPI0035E63B2A